MTLIPVTEGESVMSSEVEYKAVLIAVVDGDVDCAVGVVGGRVVCTSVDVCVGVVEKKVQMFF